MVLGAISLKIFYKIKLKVCILPILEALLTRRFKGKKLAFFVMVVKFLPFQRGGGEIGPINLSKIGG